MSQAITYFIFSVFFVLIFESTITIRVCDDFTSYRYKNALHCHDNPDGESNITEIIKRWDFTAEEHKYFTEDGYEILLVRAYSSITKNNPILVSHGCFQSSLALVNRGKNSIVNFLGSKGFDVWIINFRGSIYSRGHKNLTTDDNDYWNFSFYEMGEYDLRSALEMINKKTNQKAIYIGYSVGTTASYAYASCHPDEAKDKLKGMISLAPLAYTAEMKSYLKYILPLVPILEPIVYDQSHGEVMPRTPLRKDVCSYYSFEMYLCETALVPIIGDDYNQMDPQDQPLIQSMNYDSIGIGVLIHYQQIYQLDKFQRRDFGVDMNYQVYGQDSPLPLELNKISVPISMFVGQNDWLATQAGAERLRREIGNDSMSSITLINHSKWNHYDFVEAKDIYTLLFEPLYEEISKMCD